MSMLSSCSSTELEGTCNLPVCVWMISHSSDWSVRSPREQSPFLEEQRILLVFFSVSLQMQDLNLQQQQTADLFDLFRNQNIATITVMSLLLWQVLVSPESTQSMKQCLILVPDTSLSNNWSHNLGPVYIWEPPWGVQTCKQGVWVWAPKRTSRIAVPPDHLCIQNTL